VSKEEDYFLLRKGVLVDKHLVYDLPTRLFHWLFAGIFLSSFAIVQFVEDDTSLFNYHSLLGLVLFFLVLLRFSWGFLGTKYARFSSYTLSPRKLFSYLKGIILNKKTFWPGHNPASSYAALLMMVFALALGVSGYLMTSNPNLKESIEDYHGFFANGFMVIAVVHVLGLFVHVCQHRDFSALSMIHGKKKVVDRSECIYSSKKWHGALLVFFTGVFSLYLFLNYSSEKRELNFFSRTLVFSKP
jgi:cytochrome b